MIVALSFSFGVFLGRTLRFLAFSGHSNLGWACAARVGAVEATASVARMAKRPLRGRRKIIPVNVREPWLGALLRAWRLAWVVRRIHIVEDERPHSLNLNGRF